MDTDLTPREMQIIFDAMDKTDYRHASPNCPRYIDQDHLIAKVKQYKQENPGQLKGIRLVAVLESYPPQNRYEIDFS